MWALGQRAAHGKVSPKAAPAGGEGWEVQLWQKSLEPASCGNQVRLRYPFNQSLAVSSQRAGPQKLQRYTCPGCYLPHCDSLMTRPALTGLRVPDVTTRSTLGRKEEHSAFWNHHCTKRGFDLWLRGFVTPYSRKVWLWCWGVLSNTIYEVAAELTRSF